MNETERCLHCGQTSAEIPLIHLRYHGKDYWVCPSGMPQLIHHPEQVDALAGEWQKEGGAEHG